MKQFPIQGRIIFVLLIMLVYLTGCQKQTIPARSSQLYLMSDYFPIDKIQWITFLDAAQNDTIQWQKIDTVFARNSSCFAFQCKGKVADLLTPSIWSSDNTGLFLHQTQNRYNFQPPIQIANACIQQQTQLQRNHVRIDTQTRTRQIFHIQSTFLGTENLDTALGFIHNCLKFRLDFFAWDEPTNENSYYFWFAKDIGLVKTDKGFQQLDLKHIAINGKILPDPSKKRRRYRRRRRTVTPNFLAEKGD